jgi:hypothetical protein
LSTCATVGEFVTDGRIDALSDCLAERGVDAGHIIAILALPSQAEAEPSRFRVLYRKI